MNQGKPMESLPRFGVNYVPSANWWYSWLDWDRSSIQADLAAIAGLGMDHIRIHCLWPIFQPNPNRVSAVALGRLADLLDIADEHGLDVCVTVLDGWLSGFYFRPEWQKSSNMFTSPEMIAAEKLLFTKIAAEISDHPRFLGFDLGNELGVLQAITEPVTQSQADTWLREMFELCYRLAPGKIHVTGVDHGHWFGDAGFSRQKLAEEGSLTALHAWIKFTGAMDRYAPLGTGCTHLPEYCIELAKAYQTDPDRQVWLQEFGASKSWMPEADIPQFAEQAIESALSCGNVWGITWWCSHDIDESLSGFDQLEYDLGLLDTRNHVKPVGGAVADMIARVRLATPGQLISLRPVALVVPDDLFSGRTGHSAWDAGEAFMRLLSRGVRPAIVLESRVNDRAYLQSRGISSLEHVPMEIGHPANG